MSKYEPLRRYLEGLAQDEWRASFSDIEAILGFGLPRSAHDYAAWWANERDPQSAHKDAWLGAGWRAEELSLTAKQVIFRRTNGQTQQVVPKTNKTRFRLPQSSSILVEKSESEAACTIHLAWTPIGQIDLDAGGKLVFRRAPSSPGLYRFTIEVADRKTVYIGEADSLARRFQHYRTPGPGQETNLRINALMLQATKDGGRISVAVIIAARLRTGEQERPADFSSKSERVFFEHAALLMSRVPGIVFANK